MVTKERPIQYCGVIGCGKSFDRPAKLRDHLRKHTGETPFQCPHCGKKFAQRKHLQVHEISHLPPQEKPFTCPHCSKGLISNQHLTRHLKTHERAQLKCPHCPRTFTQQRSFDTHVSRHVECPQCNKMLKNENQLRRHHQNQHTHICRECRRIFINKSDLDEHRKVSHKKVNMIQPTLSMLIGNDYANRPFECPEKCGRRFIRDYDLQRHLNTHRIKLK